MNPHVIFVVEDDPDIQDLITSFLRHEGYDVHCASSAAGGFELLSSREPDLIVLDIQLPDMDGITFCKHIRSDYAKPILFVTGNRQQEDKIQALMSGGDDYIQKPFDPLDLLLRVRANLRWSALLAAGARTEEASELAFPGLRIDLKRMAVWVNERQVPLLPKDFRLLTALAGHPNQVLHPEQLYRLAWEDESNFSKDTVKVHISNLRKKIEPVPSAPRFIVTVGSLGYKFNPYGAAGLQTPM
ncbi:response regulator transcription factor [Cohnella fermenti]|uniref:Response regulator transcription factor n=1 Tax=Cohnella fermenti TaxID=2565925 RepID=A0A4V3WFY8_9BACL|nr:response regulator transcription factor [Cohnella fermenti]THF82182.1 response regulator transcription factor [Cohnella fermenti]